MADEVVLNTAEIARLAGVAQGTVLTWRRRRDDFPAPAAGAVYNRAEVEAWLAAAGLLELASGPRVWREVSHRAQGGSLGKAVSDAAAVAARHGHGEALPPSVPGPLAWVIRRAVDEVGAAAVLADLLDRSAAESGIPVTPARIAECMISLAAVGDGATVLDPASAAPVGTGAARPRGRTRPDGPVPGSRPGNAGRRGLRDLLRRGDDAHGQLAGIHALR